MKDFPKLSVQRLFEEVRAAGYAGGYSRVRDYGFSWRFDGNIVV